MDIIYRVGITYGRWTLHSIMIQASILLLSFLNFMWFRFCLQVPAKTVSIFLACYRYIYVCLWGIQKWCIWCRTQAEFRMVQNLYNFKSYCFLRSHTSFCTYNTRKCRHLPIFAEVFAPLGSRNHPRPPVQLDSNLSG